MAEGRSNAAIAARDTEVVLRGGVGGIDPDRVAQVRERLIGMASFEKNPTQVVVRERVIGLDVQRLPVLTDRVVHPPCQRKRETQVEMRRRQFGLQPRRRRELNDGVVGPAKLRPEVVTRLAQAVREGFSESLIASTSVSSTLATGVPTGK